jgi:hypothetical protein
MMTSMKLLHFCGDASMKPWSYTQKLSGSLAKYVYLWQRVSWMEEHDNVHDFMWVLQLTDDKVKEMPLLPRCHRHRSLLRQEIQQLWAPQGSARPQERR